MGKRGRPPRPETLAWLSGDRRRAYKVEPAPPDSEPNAPDHLDDIAKAEWLVITGILRDMGLLTSADRTAISLYCEAYSRYRQAAENCKKYGPVILAKKTGFPLVSPYHAVMRQALKDVTWFLGQFGLTPSARAGLAVDIKDEGSEDPFIRLVG